MRIAFISPFIYRLKRGIERFTLELSKELARMDKTLSVTILTWQEKKPFNLINLHEGIKIFKVPYFRYYRSKVAIPFYLFNLIKGHYDIVNISFAGYGEAEALALLSLFRHQRFNIIFNYPYFLVPHKYKESKKFNLIHKADKIISVSKFVAEGVRDFCGAESKVINNGFNKDHFSPNDELRKKARSELGFSTEDKILLTVSALEERKGIQKVIKALPFSNRKIKSVKYVVVGKGPYEPHLKGLVEKMRLGKQVFFVGVKEDPHPFYCMADLFLLLSYGEAFPLVLPEAMGCGLPVIVSKKRPFDEIINEEIGYSVNDEEPEAVGKAITNLLLSDNLRVQMGKNARAYAVNNFSWEKIAGQYHSLFSSQIN